MFTEKLFEIKLTHSKPSQSENVDDKSKKAAMVKIVSIMNEKKQDDFCKMQTIYENGKTMIDPLKLIQNQLVDAGNIKTELIDPLSIVKQESQDFGEYQITSYIQQKSFECDFCTKKFNEKFSIENHMKNHKLKSIQCEICKNYFNTRKALTAHKKVMHMTMDIARDGNILKECQCEICGKYFKNMTYVKRHIKTTHVNNKFPCGYCGSSFPTRGELNQHVGSLWKIGKCSSFLNGKNIEKN